MIKRSIFWLVILLLSIMLFNIALSTTVIEITTELSKYDTGIVTDKFVDLLHYDYGSLIQNIMQSITNN